jgi:hypothetical protein
MALVFGGVGHEFLRRYYTDMQHKVITPALVQTETPAIDYAVKCLSEIETLWREENPRADAKTLEFLEMTMRMAEAVMPMYIRYWREDFTKSWHSQEEEFRLPMKIDVPGHRLVKTFLRGKMDGVFFQGKLRPWLFETKTKSYIVEEDIADVLPHELQVNIYMHALRKLHKIIPQGVLYNIVRRPGLRQKQTESARGFAQRMIDDIRERMDFYFVRMEMRVDRSDLDRFDGELMDLMCDFLSWWYGIGAHYKDSSECIGKYGRCPMLDICSKKDWSRYYMRDRVFRELEDI